MQFLPFKSEKNIYIPFLHYSMTSKSNYSPLRTKVCWAWRAFKPSRAVLLWKIKSNVKPAVLEAIDSSQYEAIPKSSITIALVSMLHHWFLRTDGTGARVRTILFDYRKAFDFFVHNILINKYALQHCDYRFHVKSFLTNQISWRLLLSVGSSPIWGTTGCQVGAMVIYPSDKWSYYAIPVFYNALPQYLITELVRIEKRALSNYASSN